MTGSGKSASAAYVIVVFLIAPMVVLVATLLGLLWVTSQRQARFSPDADSDEARPATLSDVDNQAPTDSDPSTNPQSSTRPATHLRLMTVHEAVARGAICNDGTPAKYYFRPGTLQHQDKWVFWFKGGGGCGDEVSCLARAEEDDPGLMSSRLYVATSREDGILSTDPVLNPDFYAWNHVKLMYCSSDNWAGNAEQSIGGQTWYFHGKAITEAILADLQNQSLLETTSLSAATQVLVAGSSAGGGGAANNLDDIALALPQAEVKGVIDSSWSYDSPLYAVRPGTETRDRSGFTDFRGTVLDDTCVAAHENDPSLCTLLSESYPYLETPAFIFQNQYDQLKVENLGLTLPLDQNELHWLETVYVSGLIESYAVVADGLFSPKQTFHTVLTHPEYRTTKINGVSLQAALTNWYFGRPGPTRVIEE